MRLFPGNASAMIALGVTLLAACTAQPAAPDVGAMDEGSILSLEVSPSRAVIQPHDTIAFDAEMVVSEDMENMPSLDWTASGGSITPEGVFVAGRSTGKIDVTVKVRGRKKKARAEVQVVDEEPQATSVRVEPERVVVDRGDTVRFGAVVLDEQGFELVSRVTWSATGGSINPSGLYTAGEGAGEYLVTAEEPDGISGTAVVEIRENGDQEVVVTSLQVEPGSVSLTSGETRQFDVTVLDQYGNPVSQEPDWTALGGSIDAGGSYTAGADAGAYPVVATIANVNDTAWVTIAGPPPPDTEDPQPLGPAGSWSLIMADEFDDAALDPALWHTAQPWSNTLINGQQQLYDNCPYPWQTWMTTCAPTPHVVEQGGTLRLIATDDEISTADWTYPFTSGAVNTIDRLWMTAPVAIEIRMKPPAGNGLWTEVWLHPELGTWPDGGEIDILELLGENPFVAHQTVHWGENGSDVGSGEPYSNGTNWTSEFHTYTVEWTESAVTFWIDGVQTHRVVGHSPQGRMHLILDLAVGGSWPVPPDASTPWPSTLEIEYVRVWDR